MKQKRLYGMDGLSYVFISTCMYSKYFPNYIGKYDFFIIRISKKEADPKEILGGLFVLL